MCVCVRVCVCCYCELPEILSGLSSNKLSTLQHVVLNVFLYMFTIRVEICAAIWKAACSIPDGCLRFFINVTLTAAVLRWGRVSLQQQQVPGILPGNKGGRCVGLTFMPPACAEYLKILRSSTFWSHEVLSRPYRKSFTFAFTSSSSSYNLCWEPNIINLAAETGYIDSD